MVLISAFAPCLAAFYMSYRFLKQARIYFFDGKSARMLSSWQSDFLSFFYWMIDFEIAFTLDLSGGSAMPILISILF